MIYLVFKIFVYLALALGLGAAGGWLLRNLAATRQEETLNRQLIEARGRIPQLESRLRGQDEMTAKLKAQLKENKAQVVELNQALKEREEALVQKEQALTRLQARADAKGGANPSVRTEAHMLVLEEVEAELGSEAEADAFPESTSTQESQELLALKAEVSRLDSALEAAKSAAASASAVPEPAADSPELLNRIAELEHELERAQRALQNEQRRVTELERERELQNRTLQVLHQQLEMAKESRGATGT